MLISSSDVDGEAAARLYYAVSSWGSQVSCIGLATSTARSGNTFVDTGTPAMCSGVGDAYNALDPAPFVSQDGRQWLSFGSFFGGIFITQLNVTTGIPMLPPHHPRQPHRGRGQHGLSGPVGGVAVGPVAINTVDGAANAVEASYVHPAHGRYYLFVNFGLCCKGTASTYRVVVGRSRAPTGPVGNHGNQDPPTLPRICSRTLMVG